VNILEKQMLEVLKELRENYGVNKVKAEFEAEGSRIEEMMRLKDVASNAGIQIVMKIGGVEAVTDVYNALAIGVSDIVAPMAETKYALSKFVNMIANYVAEDNAKDIGFSVNIETETACNNFDDMLTLPDINVLEGVTVGRVDLIGSMGLDRSQINISEDVKNICKSIFSKAKKVGLNTTIGGGIDIDALPIISAMHADGLIDKYETRKVVFPAESISYGKKTILKAVEFELLWLVSKRRYYSGVKKEDEKRIAMLEARLKQA